MLAAIMCFAFTACKKDPIEFKTEVKYSVYEQVEGENADDKKALNVHLTIGDSVDNAEYGAKFNKLYADY
ncbi:MAG: hypothetical protein IKK70_04095, partial [Clostridia bacterium]|nr:hypothetical protein [Clostridia bacterium]